MALKRKISATDFEALADVLKAEYKKEGSGYVLDTDDATDLLSARDREKAARQAAEQKAKDLQADLDAATEKRNRENGDVQALDASYKEKMAALEKRAADAEARSEKVLRDTHVTTEAQKIAARFTVPKIMQKEIASRLSVEFVNGDPVVRVLDAAGKPSALSIADLEKEFVDNPENKSIVIASKAAGSAAPNLPGSAPNFSPNSDKPVLLSAMSPKELAAHMVAKDTERA